MAKAIKVCPGVPVVSHFNGYGPASFCMNGSTGALYILKDGEVYEIPSGEGGGPHEHEIDDVTGLQTLLDSKAAVSHDHDSSYSALGHNHDSAYSAVGHNHDAAYEAKNANIQAHVAEAHAPSNAQKNSDITKAEIEAKLTGEISSHSHAGVGSDPWTYLKLANDFTTSSATAVDVNNGSLFGFTPSANTAYLWEAVLGLRTATATVNPRLGFAWSSGMTDGVCSIEQTSTATAKVMANGNIAAALLVAVGGIPTNTTSWPAICYGTVRAGASPSGNCRMQLASETAGTVVRVVASISYFRYRAIP